MRSPSYIFALIALLLAGCASSASTKSSPKQSGLIGTWRWIRVDQQRVTQPFHMRFYPDGTAVTWPAPEGYSTAKGVSHGRYHLEGDFLVIETGEGQSNPKAHMEIEGDEMVLINEESHRLIYHRVVPDLEPGK
jgi:hypothetical protein